MPMLMRKVDFEERESPATARDIRAITGPLEDTIVAAIMHTGATPSEVREAYEELVENHYTKSIFVRQMDILVRRVYDILDYAHNGFHGTGFRN